VYTRATLYIWFRENEIQSHANRCWDAFICDRTDSSLSLQVPPCLYNRSRNPLIWSTHSSKPLALLLTIATCNSNQTSKDHSRLCMCMHIMQIMYIAFSQAFEWKPDREPCDSTKFDDKCTCKEKFPVYMLVSGCLQVIQTHALHVLHNAFVANLSRGIDWFWLPIFRTNLVRGPWNTEMKFQNKGAVLVQIAPLLI